MDMRRLSKQEIEDLTKGADVFVRWSGGNGPYWYKVGKHFDSTFFHTEKYPEVVVGWPSEIEYVEVEE